MLRRIGHVSESSIAQGMLIRIAAGTTAGRREQNEDGYVVDAQRGLALVIDGSCPFRRPDFVVDLVTACVSDAAAVSEKSVLEPALQAAAVRLAELKMLPGPQGDVTAEVAGFELLSGKARLLHAGGCRIYLIRNGTMVPLTRDHTVQRHLAETGLARDNVNPAVLRMLTRTLGLDMKMGSAPSPPESMCVPICPADRLLLITDGVHVALSDREIADLVLNASISTAVDNLLDAVAHGDDNATAIVAEFMLHHPFR